MKSKFIAGYVFYFLCFIPLLELPYLHTFKTGINNSNAQDNIFETSLCSAVDQKGEYGSEESQKNICQSHCYPILQNRVCFVCIINSSLLSIEIVVDEAVPFTNSSASHFLWDQLYGSTTLTQLPSYRAPPAA